MSTAIIIVVVLLIIIALSVGGYLWYQSSPSKCKADPSVATWKIDSTGNCVANVCSTGYGIDANGTPAADGTCPTFVACKNKDDPNAMSWNTDCSIANCKSGYMLSEGSCVSDFSNWAMVPNTDYPKSGLITSTTNVDSETTCMSKCAADDTCLLTVYKPEIKGCWLKRAPLNDSVSQPGYNVYKKP
jgi:hypothetical protein